MEPGNGVQNWKRRSTKFESDPWHKQVSMWNGIQEELTKRRRLEIIQTDGSAESVNPFGIYRSQCKRIYAKLSALFKNKIKFFEWFAGMNTADTEYIYKSLVYRSKWNWKIAFKKKWQYKVWSCFMPVEVRPFEKCSNVSQVQTIFLCVKWHW